MQSKIKVSIGQKADLAGRSALELSQTYGSDGPVMYWMQMLDDHRRKSELSGGKLHSSDRSLG